MKRLKLNINRPTTRCLLLLERELIWFTLLVPILAVVSFLCGGVCSVWQWWSAAAIVTSAGFCRHERSDAAWAAAGFFAWMAVVWVLLGVLANPGGWDEIAYHIPAVRLLVAGWNPLEVRTPEAFKEAFGLIHGDLNLYHALFQMKGAWIFNAVASEFSGDPFSPMLPIVLFLFPAVFIRVVVNVRSWFCRMLCVLVLYALIPYTEFCIDAALALSAVGLMMCMYEIIRGKRACVWGLAGYTALMMTLKLNGVIQAFVIWMVFAAFVLFLRMRLRRYVCSLLIAACAVIPLAITPFVTSAIDYGHPLYPHRSSDPRHPAIDLVGDFVWRTNDDFKSMSQLGKFIWAYVSPDLAALWYRHSLDRAEFRPYSRNLAQYPNLSDDQGITALRWPRRCLFWLGLVVLVAVAGKRGLMIALMVLLSVVAVPPLLVGYTRYVPWLFAPLTFLLVEFSAAERKSRLLFSLGLLFSLFAARPLSLPHDLIATGWNVYGSYLMRKYLNPERSTIPDVFYGSQSSVWLAHFKLAQRLFPCLREREIVAKWCDDPLGRPENINVFPGGLFGYDRRYGFLEMQAEITALGFDDSNSGKLAFIFQVGFMTFPRLVLHRLGAVDF